MTQSEHQAAELRKTAHPADAGVAGGDSSGLGKIVHHGVAVVGAERKLPIGATPCASAILFIEQVPDDCGHIHRAGEVVGFVK